MTQGDLFTATKPKLSRQCSLILELFQRQEGRATNVEMCDIALNYRARVSELRQANYDIEVIEKRARGVRVYELTL